MAVINQYNGISFKKIKAVEMVILVQIVVGLISKAITNSFEVYADLFIFEYSYYQLSVPDFILEKKDLFL